MSESDTRIEAMFREGVSVGRISAQLNLNPGTVYKALRALGVKFPRENDTDTNAERLDKGFERWVT